MMSNYEYALIGGNEEKMTVEEMEEAFYNPFEGENMYRDYEPFDENGIYY